ncbi:histidine kinase/DNA gyrase B/HSP90-like ATPase [Kribbella antiqua]|uniref:histidine kinase n=1 Tax=Kribbella antiqua TaxID=2512217 RepID=A0A4V2S2I2_9ACTN|nr:histidine kinase/DNA gyrase B/HSP90-like ATPase [Kribbella antiqua]
MVVEIAAVVLSWRLEPTYDTLLYAVFGLTTVGAGAVIAQRRPENPIGWLFCGFGLLNTVTSDLLQGWGLRAATEGWPGGPLAEWISSSSWLTSGYGWTLTFLLFPTGRLPGPRWRLVPWTGAAGLVLGTAAWSLSPDRGRDFVGGRNPWAVESLPTGLLLAVGMPLFLGSLIAAVLSLAVRFRNTSGLERQQLKWFVLAACVAGVALPMSFALWYVTPVAGVLAAVALSGLPLAAGAAILRYRLYDIDLFISRTVAYATLTVSLAAAYVVLIIALGTLFGRSSGWATAAATVVCAILFHPLRRRIQDAVDRRFNRSRYDALRRMAAFLDDVRGGRRAPEDVQTVLRDIFADPHLELLMFLPESQRYVDLAGNPRYDDDRHRIAIERGAQPIGVVLHNSKAEFSPELLRRVVEEGGLAVEIARLRAEVRLQLSEVEASRARIVAAGHAERRRIERDLHDGAQQRLVSIGLALRHAQHQLGSSADAVGSTLDRAVAEVSVAIGELRELARGLPPTQLDAGLAPAFHDLARRAPLPVSVDVPSERFEPGVEAAAYFICCEGLTNAVKHANATRVDLAVRCHQQRLLVTVKDDGAGGADAAQGTGLTGLADRVAALGGTFHIDSTPGKGTTLTAELPCGS